MNSATLLVSLCNKYEHMTGSHWLPTEYCIEYKILLLSFNCIPGQSPQSLSDLISPATCRSLHFTSQNLLAVKRGEKQKKTDVSHVNLHFSGISFPYSICSESPTPFKQNLEPTSSRNNQACESSDFNLISDFFALHKPPFSDF